MVAEIWDTGSYFLSYTWYSQDNYERAVKWTRGAVLARGINEQHLHFLEQALFDLYDGDRAGRAASALRTEPLRRRDIPARITRRINRPVLPLGLTHEARGLLTPVTVQTVPYQLVEKDFSWDSEVPYAAVDAVILVLETETPDRLWIAEYVEDQRTAMKWDPIIYAEYGDWQVEVARWE
jgi:hypothetical protein